MKKVLYVSRAGLPIDATGIRMANIGDLLMQLGYQIHYVCQYRINQWIMNSGYSRATEKSCPGFSLAANETHFLDRGCVYSYLPAHDGGKLTSLHDTVELYTAKQEFLRVKKLVEEESPSIIILYNDLYGLTKRLIPYCRKQRIKLIADVTEWYEERPEEPFSARMIAKLTDRRIRILDRRLDGVISISPYFHEYYQELGVKSILIPPLMQIDKDKEKISQTEVAAESPIRFVYAGSPGGKDIVYPFVNAIVRAADRGIRVRLDLIGLSEQDLAQNGCANADPEHGVNAHGRLPHEKTVELVKQADFGFLFRHNQRYAKTGFSTKFAECMSNGVAMVCNRIGGTDKLVEDGVDGYLLDAIEENVLDHFLNMLGEKTRTEIELVKQNAKNKAMNLFASCMYQDKIGKFLSNM